MFLCSLVLGDSRVSRNMITCRITIPNAMYASLLSVPIVTAPLFQVFSPGFSFSG